MSRHGGQHPKTIKCVGTLAALPAATFTMAQAYNPHPSTTSHLASTQPRSTTTHLASTQPRSTTSHLASTQPRSATSHRGAVRGMATHYPIGTCTLSLTSSVDCTFFSFERFLNQRRRVGRGGEFVGREGVEAGSVWRGHAMGWGRWPWPRDRTLAPATPFEYG